MLRCVKMLDLVDRLSQDLDVGYERRFWRRRDVVPYLDIGEVTSASGLVQKKNDVSRATAHRHPRLEDRGGATGPEERNRAMKIKTRVRGGIT